MRFSMKELLKMEWTAPRVYDTLIDKIRPVGEPVFLGCEPQGNVIYRTAKPNNKTMDYRVTTDILESIDKGDLLKKSRYKSDIFIHRPTKKKFTLDSLLRNPDWFEPVEEAQEGDYLKYGKSIYRIHTVKDHGAFPYKATLVVGDANHKEDSFSRTHLREGKLSTDEIEQALVKEVKRRFSAGDIVETKQNNFGNHQEEEPFKVTFDDIDYMPLRDQLYDGNILLYDSGEFAQIVDQTPDIEINGNKVEFNDHPKVGCTTIKKEVFIEQAKIIARHGVRIHREREDITDQILAIASHYGWEAASGVIFDGTIIRGTLKDVTFSSENVWGNND